MARTKTETTKVAVTRCEHCGLERWGFAAAEGDCPRCGSNSAQQYTRWMDAHAEMVARARNQSRTG